MAKNGIVGVAFLVVILAVIHIIVLPIHTVWKYNMSYMPIYKGIEVLPIDVVQNIYILFVLAVVYYLVDELSNMGWEKTLTIIGGVATLLMLCLKPVTMSIILNPIAYCIHGIVQALDVRITVYMKMAMALVNITVLAAIMLSFSRRCKANANTLGRDSRRLGYRTLLVLLLLFLASIMQFFNPKALQTLLLSLSVILLLLIPYPPTIPKAKVGEKTMYLLSILLLIMLIIRSPTIIGITTAGAGCALVYLTKRLE